MRKKGKGRGKKAAREEGPTSLIDTREPAPPPGATASPAAPTAPAAPVATPIAPTAAAPVASAPADTPDDDELREREEIAEALYKAAVARAEIAEAMYKAAVARAEMAEVREKAAAALTHALEAREKAAAERDAIANARDRAALERDAIATARDKAATDRDVAATDRDKAAAQRDAALAGRVVAPGEPSATLAEADAELEKARLEAELQRAHLDALTGAFRREMGRLALRNEIDRARRGDGNFVIAFIDVDGLKGVNDREGHAAGDRILRTLVATMRANLRSYDPIVRFGGDEFIFGVASIDPSEVQHRIGVIDQSLRSATGVGITAGLATLSSGESLDELTARADAALIEAKRNRGQEEDPAI
jgi:diguanylate cyclase (GGDEF)-like protein